MINLKYIRYDVSFMTNEKIQEYLNSSFVRGNFKAWCIVLDEKLKRNEL